MFAFGCEENHRSSVGLYDLSTKIISASVRGAHEQGINNVIWIDHKNYLLTGSFDFTIRVFKAFHQGKSLRPIHIFKGHTNVVASMRYIKNEKLLVSTGYDADIKLWTINTFRRCGIISTNSDKAMEGSIAYIEADRLIGVAFKAGFIRFYDLRRRDLVFQLNMGYEICNLYGLRYLPKKKMIIANIIDEEIRTWSYFEGERRIRLEGSICAKYCSNCIVVSNDESQLLYKVYKAGRQSIEAYDFTTNKTTLYDLPHDIKRPSCLISMGARGVPIGDTQSGNIFTINLESA